MHRGVVALPSGSRCLPDRCLTAAAGRDTSVVVSVAIGLSGKAALEISMKCAKKLRCMTAQTECLPINYLLVSVCRSEKQ